MTQFQDVLYIINPTAGAGALSSDDVGGDSEVSPIALTEALGTTPPPTHTHYPVPWARQQCIMGNVTQSMSPRDTPSEARVSLAERHE